MDFLVRNSDRVSDCIFFQANDVPQEELLQRPEVQNFLGGRKVLRVEFQQPNADSTYVVNLDLGR